jgi:hypothetical protein
MVLGPRLSAGTSLCPGLDHLGGRGTFANTRAFECVCRLTDERDVHDASDTPRCRRGRPSRLWIAPLGAVGAVMVHDDPPDLLQAVFLDAEAVDHFRDAQNPFGRPARLKSLAADRAALMAGLRLA